MQTSSWLEDCVSYDSRLKRQVFVKLHSQLSSETFPEYLYAIEMLLGALYSIVSTSLERTLVLRVVELFGRIASNAENHVVFTKCPDHLLQFFVEFMCTNSSIIDPFHILPSADNTDSSSIAQPASVLAGGTNATTHQLQKYQDLHLTRFTKIPPSICSFFTEMNDLECRDAALDVIGCLAAMTPRIQVEPYSFVSVLYILQLLFDLLSA